MNTNVHPSEVLEPIRLTTLAHGGGCGCKIAPAVLQQIMAAVPAGALPPQLLVGTESSDDAAVYQINATQALVATTDFFTPIVDDAFDFGRIAATNALSDVYAMGAQPILALAIVGMPLKQLPPEQIARILQGGASVCADAGIPLAGGHSIDIAEPVYGLVGLGLLDPQQLKKNSGAQAGDALVLGKPLGVGILSAALKKGLLSDTGYADMLRVTTMLNRAGPALAQLPAVHAMTDVTGFGLAGHLLEMCRASQLAAQVDFARLPLLDLAVQHARAGIATGASTRNWASYGAEVQLPAHLPEWQQKLLTDPQTSGGLLVACVPQAVPQVLDIFHQHGCAEAAVIGQMQTGAARLRVTCS
ncbi:MAG: selenide, water dikinase SelD [Brachymonas sp.]|nr:selenide, water dikinase SelD [Brachymonas sp.]